MDLDCLSCRDALSAGRTEEKDLAVDTRLKAVGNQAGRGGGVEV